MKKVTKNSEFRVVVLFITITVLVLFALAIILN